MVIRDEIIPLLTDPGQNYEMRRWFIDIRRLFKHTAPARQSRECNYVKRVNKSRQFADLHMTGERLTEPT